MCVSTRCKYYCKCEEESFHFVFLLSFSVVCREEIRCILFVRLLIVYCMVRDRSVVNFFLWDQAGFIIRRLFVRAWERRWNREVSFHTRSGLRYLVKSVRYNRYYCITTPPLQLYWSCFMNLQYKSRCLGSSPKNLFMSLRFFRGLRYVSYGRRYLLLEFAGYCSVLLGPLKSFPPCGRGGTLRRLFMTKELVDGA